MRITHAVKAALFSTGGFALLRRVRPHNRIAILRYHAIVEPFENDYAHPTICLSPRDFESHVRYFSRNYRVLSLPEAITLLKEGAPVPQNAVVFTFDDGYADNMRAAEILAKYGATGTFYLTAGCIEREEPFWLSEVIHMLQRTSQLYACVEAGGERLELELGNRAQRWKMVKRVVALIKGNNLQVREKVRQQLREQLQDVDRRRIENDIMLTWDQVREMQRAGMTIGAHTRTHLNLPNAGEQDAVREVESCKQLLESRIEFEVSHFSYPNSGPYAYYTPEVREIVGRCGYESSATSYFGYADYESDLLALRRVRTVPSLVETVAGLELARFTGP